MELACTTNSENALFKVEITGDQAQSQGLPFQRAFFMMTRARVASRPGFFVTTTKRPAHSMLSSFSRIFHGITLKTAQLIVLQVEDSEEMVFQAKDR